MATSATLYKEVADIPTDKEFTDGQEFYQITKINPNGAPIETVTGDAEKQKILDAAASATPAGPPVTDAGPPVTDAGPPVTDAATTVTDAATTVTDAGPPGDAATGAAPGGTNLEGQGGQDKKDGEDAELGGGQDGEDNTKKDGEDTKEGGGRRRSRRRSRRNSKKRHSKKRHSKRSKKQNGGKKRNSKKNSKK